MTTEQDYSGVKNIIFDLGGVFLNIDFAKTEAAFKDLGVNDFHEMFTQHHANDLFIQLETGVITEIEFYDAFRVASGVHLTNEQIKTAWNALLLDFRLPTMAWLESIKEKYKTFLFSNTNQIHHNAFHASYKEQTGRDNFDEFFIKAYRGNFLLLISGIATHFWDCHPFLGLPYIVPLRLFIGCRVYSSVTG
jgi:putative hydrolase of the HAD superfamily